MGEITPNAVAVEALRRRAFSEGESVKTIYESSACNFLGLAGILDVDNSPLIFNNVCILKYR